MSWVQHVNNTFFSLLKKICKEGLLIMFDRDWAGPQDMAHFELSL